MSDPGRALKHPDGAENTSMPNSILIHMVVPIPDHQGDLNSGSMTFGGWLPMQEDERLVVSKDNIQLKLGFDMTCVGNLGVTGLEELSNTPVFVNLILIDAVITDIQNEVIDEIIKISSRDFISIRDYNDNYVQKYENLGKELYIFLMQTLNRLNTYLRSDKMQFWLGDFEESPDLMASAFVKFRAQYTLDGKQWDAWRPTNRSRLNFQSMAFSSSSDECITREDWKRAGIFVQSTKRRSSLVRELLATAYSHAWGERRRSALFDAVSALEVAISAFVRSPKAREAFGNNRAFRIDTDSLHSQFQKLGVRGTVRYLFPVIFSEEKIPTELIKDCHEAILERNRVAHEGKTTLSKKQTFKHIWSIKKLCRIIDEYTKNTSEI
jgi:hypothetical protein